MDPDQAGCFVRPDLNPKVCKSYQQMTLVDKELSSKILVICHSILVEEICSLPCGSHISYQFAYQHIAYPLDRDVNWMSPVQGKSPLVQVNP